MASKATKICAQWLSAPAEGFKNSITMQVILSAPRPSEAAKLAGQIFSIIISTILERTTGPLAGPGLVEGELVELDLVSDRADAVPAACTVCAAVFFTGDTPAFRTPCKGIVAVF